MQRRRVETADAYVVWCYPPFGKCGSTMGLDIRCYRVTKIGKGFFVCFHCCSVPYVRWFVSFSQRKKERKKDIASESDGRGICERIDDCFSVVVL